MITDAEINHIAKLARIELDEAHQEKFKKELSSILGYIDTLNEVDVTGVSPLYQVTGLTGQMRADEHRGDFVMDETLTERLIGQAPAHEGRLVKVRSVKTKTE
jgi:aspartyl-tRNA(Asn)/glutamyl-tRNA(Gln) amidotransferase subunit C